MSVLWAAVTQHEYQRSESTGRDPTRLVSYFRVVLMPSPSVLGALLWGEKKISTANASRSGSDCQVSRADPNVRAEFYGS